MKSSMLQTKAMLTSVNFYWMPAHAPTSRILMKSKTSISLFSTLLNFKSTVTDIAWNKICSDKIESREVFAWERMFKKDDWFGERQFSILHKIVLNLLPKSRSLERELYESTSTIDLADSEGRTPLSWAAERGNPLAVEILLRYGANLLSRSITGMTPLHYAAKAHDSACLEFLLDNGASVAAKNKWSQSPLNIASFFQNDSSFIATLLSHGADINEKDCYSVTALICSTFMNNFNTAAYLISRGANINSQDRMGVTALHVGIENNSHECISLLLDNSGLDLSIVDHDGATALHIVAHCADLQTLHIFQGMDHLEDLDPDARNNAGLTATEVFAQRADVVGTDIEMAFQHLMKMMHPNGGSGLSFYDTVEKMPLPVGNAVEVTLKEGLGSVK